MIFAQLQGHRRAVRTQWDHVTLLYVLNSGDASVSLQPKTSPPTFWRCAKCEITFFDPQIELIPKKIKKNKTRNECYIGSPRS